MASESAVTSEIERALRVVTLPRPALVELMRRELAENPVLGSDAPNLARGVEARAADLRADVIVVQEEGALTVVANDDGLPALFLDEARARRSASSEEARRGLEANIERARGLIRSVNQRQRALVRIAAAIVEQQPAFFSLGSPAPAALSHAQVARAAGLQEASVRRLSHDRFMATPLGLLEFATFFGVEGDGSGGDSAASSGAAGALPDGPTSGGPR